QRFLVAMLVATTLKAATTEETAVSFPPSSAQKWVLPDGLTLIVQEDHSAPVASVQAWCGTGSVDED
ncbi:MAG: insulinase family protein, partial [Verrucomicrobia bacterium]